MREMNPQQLSLDRGTISSTGLHLQPGETTTGEKKDGVSRISVQETSSDQSKGSSSVRPLVPYEKKPGEKELEGNTRTLHPPSEGQAQLLDDVSCDLEGLHLTDTVHEDITHNTAAAGFSDGDPEQIQTSVQETRAGQANGDSSVLPWNLFKAESDKRGETPLKEYIRSVQPLRKILLKLVMDILCEIMFWHSRDIVHGDVSLENVVVDIHDCAKLINFQSSKRVKYRGREIADELQKALRLACYILSGGRESCLFSDLENHVSREDQMNLQDILSHPIFYTDFKKLCYLQAVGNLPDRFFSDSNVHEITKGKSFHNWRKTMEEKFPKFLKEMDEHKNRKEHYSECTVGLLRFIRNAFQHRFEYTVAVDFIALFPDLFETIFSVAEEMQWNTKNLRLLMFKNLL